MVKFMSLLLDTSALVAARNANDIETTIKLWKL
jgi:hypothetical protein